IHTLTAYSLLCLSFLFHPPPPPVLYTLSLHDALPISIGIIGLFYLLTLALGFGAAALVGSKAITEQDPGGNIAAPLLAQELGRRSEEHTSELQSLRHLVCRLLLEKKKKKKNITTSTQ